MQIQEKINHTPKLFTMPMYEATSLEFWQGKPLKFDNSEDSFKGLKLAIQEVFVLSGIVSLKTDFVALMVEKYAKNIQDSEKATVIKANQIKKCFNMGIENNIFKAYDGNLPSISQFYECIDFFIEWRSSQTPIYPKAPEVEKKIPTRREILGGYFELSKNLGNSASSPESLINFFILLGEKEYTRILKPFWGLSDEELENIVIAEISKTKDRLIAESAPKEITAMTAALRNKRIEEIESFDASKLEIIAKKRIAKEQNLLVFFRNQHLSTDEFLLKHFDNQQNQK